MIVGYSMVYIKMKNLLHIIKDGRN